MKKEGVFISIGKVVIIIGILLWMYLPIATIIFRSFFVKKFFSFSAFKSLFFQIDTMVAIKNSIFLALTAIIIASIISFIGMFFYFFGGRIKIYSYLWYPNISIPDIVIAIALLFTLAIFKINSGYVLLAISHSIVGIGYIFPLLLQRWNTFNAEIITAAYDLGASSLKIISTIIFPILWPAFIQSGLLFFIISIDNYVFSYFCGDPSFSTLSGILLSMMRFGVQGEFYALSVCIIFCSIIIGSFHNLYRSTTILEKKM